MRGASALRMRPKFAELAVAVGALKLTWLNALNSSPRNCNLTPCPGSEKNLETEMSVFDCAGPLMALFGTSP